MTFALHSENMTIASTLLLTNAPEGIAMQQFAQLFLVTGLVFFVDMNIQKIMMWCCLWPWTYVWKTRTRKWTISDYLGSQNQAKLGFLFSNDLKTLHVNCISWDDDFYRHSGQKDIPISEIEVPRPGFQSRTRCLASPEFNHSTTATP